MSNPYTPPSTNLALWLKADQITGLTNGQGVAEWDDQSTSALNFFQATGALQPTYQTNVQNGLPSVRFNNGAACSMQAVSGTTVSSGESFSAFMVTKTVTSAFSGVLWIGGTTVAVNNGVLLFNGDGSELAYDPLGGTLAGYGTVAPVGAAVSEYFYTKTGVSVAMYLNGILLTTIASPFPWQGGPTATIGCNPALITVGVPPAAADWFEIMVYSGVLSSTDRQTVENYLLYKWINAAPPTPPAVTGYLIPNLPMFVEIIGQ